MVIRGVPAKVEDYFMADGDEAFRLEQTGVHPVYFDGTVSYFRKTNKLKKACARLGIDLL